ncbi:MAG TPA: hypothetical protein VHE12_00035 [bacterium]|nr:hypothetical protein [bacterium]
MKRSFLSVMFLLLPVALFAQTATYYSGSSDHPVITVDLTAQSGSFYFNATSIYPVTHWSLNKQSDPKEGISGNAEGRKSFRGAVQSPMTENYILTVSISTGGTSRVTLTPPKVKIQAKNIKKLTKVNAHPLKKAPSIQLTH